MLRLKSSRNSCIIIGTSVTKKNSNVLEGEEILTSPFSFAKFLIDIDFRIVYHMCMIQYIQEVR